MNAGEPAPLFVAPSPHNPQFNFSSLGGRYLLMAFLPAPGPERDSALRLIADNQAQFDPEFRAFFGVLPDTDSFDGLPEGTPFHWFGDPNGELRRVYGAIDGGGALAPKWVVIDPSLRIVGTAPLEAGAMVVARLVSFGHPDNHAGVQLHAPVLIVPRLLEPAFCRKLIGVYHAVGGQPSGVMQERDGKTVGVLNNRKKRYDAEIADEGVRAHIRMAISRRLAPEIEKAFQFRATRIERYIVACYDAERGGYFRTHRDNTTPGTAHRKFAVSINLNAEEFEGGDLRFPEFGSRTYRPPTGGAVVFSCSLLHEATPVTKGVRYACLPFLYDDAGAEIREANRHTLVETVINEVGETAV